MELEQKSISLEKALRSAGYHEKRLYPRHLEKTFKVYVKEGKILRIQFKEMVFASSRKVLREEAIFNLV
jgi:hypothetical protein